MSKLREKILDFCELISCNKKKIDKRYEDLFQFIQWGIKNLPEVVKDTITSNNIVLGNKSDNICIQFTTADYYWWKNFQRQHPLVLIKDIKAIEEDILNKIVDLSTKTHVEISKKELEETLKKIDEIYK